MEHGIMGALVIIFLVSLPFLFIRRDSEDLKKFVLAQEKREKWDFLLGEIRDLLKSSNSSFSPESLVGEIFVFKHTNKDYPIASFTVVGKIEGVYYKNNALTLQISNEKFHGIVLNKRNGWLIIERGGYSHSHILIDAFLESDQDITKAKHYLEARNYVHNGNFELFENFQSS